MEEQLFVLEVVNKINNREENRKTAASKPVADALSILVDKLNFKKVSIYYNIDYSLKRQPIKYIYSFLKYLIALRKAILKLPENSILLIQYVLPGKLYKYRAIEYISKILNRRTSVTKIGYIHDIDSFRDESFAIKDEIKSLNLSFDVLIVHNEKMKKCLEENGLITKMVELNIFDYLSKPILSEKQHTSPLNKIAFTGNLEKSGFIYKLNKITNWSFFLYGPNYDQELLPKNINNVFYKGAVRPEELSLILCEYDFGLVWDGDEIESLMGRIGNYMKMNNPFKLSSYIEAGIPIITSKEAGIAGFVEKEGIGITVQSLEDLNNIEINEEEYYQFKKNIMPWKEKIINGEILYGLVQRLITEA